MSGSSVGTYGVYSLGALGAVKGTGWLGYLRVDYTNGPNINGWTGTGGIRYQFLPEAPRPALIAKAPAEPVTGPTNWTGFYIGGFGGAAFAGDAKTTFPPTPPPPPRPGIGILTSPGSSSSSGLAGFLGGAAIGYNYQVGRWVWGLGADFALVDIEGHKACGAMLPFTDGTSLQMAQATINSLFNVTCNHRADWLITTTGRLGYAQGNVLYYAKAGAAWLNEDFSVSCNVGPVNGSNVQSCYSPTTGNLLSTISANDTRLGWTAGLGSEFALTKHWSAVGEVSYFGFPSRDLTASDGTPVSTRLSFWQGKIGVNYRIRVTVSFLFT